MLSTFTESDNISMLREVDKLQFRAIDKKFVSLIPSRFPPISLYERLTEHHQTEFAELESRTNPRLREKQKLLNATTPYGVEPPLLQNWNHAPFTYINPEGSRFFDINTATLEVFDELQTALAVSVRKRETFLGRTQEKAIDLDMRVLTRQVKGRFLDCRHLSRNLESTKRQLGRLILKKYCEIDGILFSPVERPNSIAVAVLNGHTLGNAVQGEHFRFVWDGQKIDTLYAFRTAKTIKSAALSLTQEAL